MLGTIIWSVWEVGTDFWALAPRLDILGILGLWLLVPAVTRGINNLGSSKVALSSTLAIAIVLMVYSIFNDPQEINGEIKTPQPETAQAVPGVAESDWPAYGRTQAGERYSPLKQINDQNVKDLKVARHSVLVISKQIMTLEKQPIRLHQLKLVITCLSVRLTSN